MPLLILPPADRVPRLSALATARGIYLSVVDGFVLLDPADRGRVHAALAMGVPLRVEAAIGRDVYRQAWRIAQDPRSERLEMAIEPVVTPSARW